MAKDRAQRASDTLTSFMSSKPSARASGNCPVCDGSTLHYRFVTDGYRVAACAGCGLLTHRRGDGEAREVEQTGWQRLTPRPHCSEDRRRWLELLRRLSPTGSVAEVAPFPTSPQGAIAVWDALGFSARPDAF